MKLFVQTWPVADASAVICISHGYGDHSGRYEQVARRLNREGWMVIAPDHRGHGRSPGTRGYVDRWSDYVEDLDEAIRDVFRGTPHAALPRVVIGHSMGGLVAAAYALAYGESLQALVLLSPLFEIGSRISPTQALQARVLSRLWPRYSAVSNIDPGQLSRDPAIGAAYRADALTHDRVTARWLTEAWAAMADVYDRAGQIRIPALLCIGDADRVIGVPRAHAFYHRLGAQDRHLSIWPGAYHELFNELEQDRFLDELVAWLLPRLGTVSA